MTARQLRNRRRPGKDGQARGSRFRKRPAPVPDGYLAVGRVLGAHGLRGEVKVESYTDFDSRFAAGQQLLLGDELFLTEVAAARPHKGIFLLTFAEITDRAAAESLHNEWLYIPEDAAMKLDEDSFWVHDIVGLSVQTETHKLLGEVTDVIFTGANEVYVIQPAPGVNRDRELLIPALTDVIRAVDFEAGVVTVRLLAGMLDSG